MRRKTEFDICAILFDLDGVLVDSSAVVHRHWKRWADRHDLPFERVMAVAHGRRSAETVRLVAPHLDAEAEGRLREAEEGLDTDGLAVCPAARELLQSLPRAAWAVVTSGNRQTAATRLAFADLPVPGALVTADDVTRGKPDPEPYLLAARRLGVQVARCLVIEDAPSGIEAARAARMRSIAVTTTHEPSALRQADAVVSDLAKVRVTRRGELLRVALRQ